MRGFGLQRQRPVADQLRIAAVLLRKIGRWMPQYALYSMGLHSFQELAKEANAVYHVKRIVLVNTEVIDEYMENFRDE